MYRAKKGQTMAETSGVGNAKYIPPGGELPPPVEQPAIGQIGELPVALVSANDPQIKNDALVADAQLPVTPPPAPPIAHRVVRPNFPHDPTLSQEAKGKLIIGRDALITKIGQGPKADKPLFGSFGPTIHRSTHYKAVLAALDAYHHLLKDSGATDLGTLDAAVDALLEVLELKCADYLKAPFAPNKAAMKEFLKDVQQQRAALVPAMRLLEQIDDVGQDLSLPELMGLMQTHPGITADDVRFLADNDLLGLVRANPKLTMNDLRFAASMGLSQDAVKAMAHDYLGTLAKVLDRDAAVPGKSEAKADVGRMPSTMHELAQTLKTVIDAARAHGVTPQDARAYFNAGIAINPLTVGGGTLQGDLKPLGHGAVNEVFVGTYQSANGKVYEAVFKEATKLDVATATLTYHNEDLGIDPADPQYALRNLASCVVDKHAQTNVLVKTELAVINGKVFVVMEKAPGAPGSKDGEVKLAIKPAMERALLANPKLAQAYASQFGATDLVRTAPGSWKLVGLPKDRKITAAHDFASPEVRRQLTMLQWLDALTGQADRHHNNYFVSVDGQGQVVVKGIDNDVAFGAKQTTATNWRPQYKRPGELPEVIDRATANALLALHQDPSALKQELEMALPPGEVDATLLRLDQIAQKVRQLVQDGKVIDNAADWGPRPDGSDPVGGWLGLKPYNPDTEVSDYHQTANTSYVARDGHLVDHAQHGHTAIKPSLMA